MSLTIEEANKNWENGPTYHLVEWEDSERDYLCSYGKQKPTFTYPSLHNGLAENYLPDIPDGEVDLLIDDPPYGTTQAQWDKEPDWADIADEYHRVMADDATLVIFGKQPSLFPVYNVFTDHGFDFRFEMIWKKHTNPWVSDSAPIPIHENIFVFCKSGTKAGDLTFNTENIKRQGMFVCHECQDKQERGSWSVTRTDEGKSQTQGGWDDEYEAGGDSMRYPISYLDDHILDATALPSHEDLSRYATEDAETAANRLRMMADAIEESGSVRDVLEFHSVTGTHDEYMGYAAQKPTNLLSWLILAMSKTGDTVLDPHMGSGSTAAACIPLCRDAIGIEVDPERYKDAEERIETIMDSLRGLKHATVEEKQPNSNRKQLAGDD